MAAKDFLPRAIPLVTVDPYFNIWSFSDHLYDDTPRHWTGHQNSMTGIIRVDGKITVLWDLWKRSGRCIIWSRSRLGSFP